jgi:hypothetical protein
MAWQPGMAQGSRQWFVLQVKEAKSGISFPALVHLQQSMAGAGLHCMEVFSPTDAPTDENPSAVPYVFFMMQDGLPSSCDTQLALLQEMAPQGRLRRQELHGDAMESCTTDGAPCLAPTAPSTLAP